MDRDRVECLLDPLNAVELPQVVPAADRATAARGSEHPAEHDLRSAVLAGDRLLGSLEQLPVLARVGTRIPVGRSVLLVVDLPRLDLRAVEIRSLARKACERPAR
jgi:hypothetical protein